MAFTKVLIIYQIYLNLIIQVSTKFNYSGFFPLTMSKSHFISSLLHITLSVTYLIKTLPKCVFLPLSFIL
jgi:hypothetical protein